MHIKDYKSNQKRNGGGTQIRTGDTLIFSQVLYRLSYPATYGELIQKILLPVNNYNSV